MDDVQDSFIPYTQSRLMDLFIGKQIPLHLAIIADSIGNDSRVVDKIKLGLTQNLFEIGVHGYHHIDHSKLDKENQTQAMMLASQRISDVFGGIRPVIFVPPFGAFNDATLDAMHENGMSILSSSITRDDDLSDHLSATVDYHDPEQRDDVDDLVSKYGYAVLVFHPQDFVQTDDAGRAIKMQSGMEMVLQDELQEFTALIDDLVSKYKPMKMQQQQQQQQQQDLDLP